MEKEETIQAKRKVAFYTLGCKVNQYETNAMIQQFQEHGYELVDFEEKADIYIINTCTVTNMSDKKSREMLRRAKKQNPVSTLVAVGCYAQVGKEKLEQIPEIDLILGTNEKNNIVAYVEKYRKEKKREEVVTDVMQMREFQDFGTITYTDKNRAAIKVQDGCDRFCSYCIIPYARGRVRSREQTDVVSEVKSLAANGYKEIVLTGIHLSSYGIDFDGERHLLDLIRAVHEIEDIVRIRLGSLEPGIITEDFASELSRLPKICPHFHLSLQSGSDATLKRMNRRYTSAEYYEKCCILRKYFNDPALTTDVIVGFPGETEEEFRQSLAFVDKIDFYETHIFKYSKREGTKAARMDGQIDEQVKTARSAEMIELDRRKRKAYEQKFIGKTVDVLVEEDALINGEKVQTGHTKEYIKIAVKSSENLKNCIVKVQIENDSQIIR